MRERRRMHPHQLLPGQHSEPTRSCWRCLSERTGTAGWGTGLPAPVPALRTGGGLDLDLGLDCQNLGPNRDSGWDLAPFRCPCLCRVRHRCDVHRSHLCRLPASHEEPSEVSARHSVVRHHYQLQSMRLDPPGRHQLCCPRRPLGCREITF
eukprot:SAG31_NODE_1009_length_10404_cov_27.639981_3_plen_151_part_00